MTDYMHMY